MNKEAALFFRVICGLLFLPAFSAAQQWNTYLLDEFGSGSAIALDGDDRVHIAYMQGPMSVGDSFHVFYALLDPQQGTFEIETVDAGGFWPHVALAFGPDNIPHIVFHDHGQGDLIHSTKTGGVWVNTPLNTNGHDGWSCAVTVDALNRPHVTYLDPIVRSPTGRGVEYAWRDGLSWNIEADIGANPYVTWFNGTSIDLDDQGNPWISYFDDIPMDLMLAAKSGGTWTINPVDSPGDVGRWSSMKLDAGGEPRIAYYVSLSPTSGIVRLAQSTGSAWIFTNVDTLENVDLAAVPEHMIALDIDAQGITHLAYCDRKVLSYATVVGSFVTSKEVLVDERSSPDLLGQRASLAVDAAGNPHISYVGFTDASLQSVYYTSRQVTSPPVVSDIPNQTVAAGGRFTALLLGNYVADPDNPDSEITWSFSGNTSLIIRYNAAAQRVQVRIPPGWTGNETITFTAADPDGNTDNDAATFTVNPLQESPGSNVSLKAERTYVEGNFPNPFNPSTTLRYTLANDAHVIISIFNTLGQEVTTLVDEFHQAGSYTVIWHGINNTGALVAGGLYFYRFSAGSTLQTGRMMLAK
jgi:hypothetical protein